MAKKSPRQPSKTQLRSLAKEIFSLLKNQYDVFQPPEDKLPVLEQAILAVLAENSREADARAVLHRLKTQFADWNEVRVAPIQELMEYMGELPDAELKARHVKKLLYDVFETIYRYELEEWLKGGPGKTVPAIQGQCLAQRIRQRAACPRCLRSGRGRARPVRTSRVDENPGGFKRSDRDSPAPGRG